MTTDFVTIHKIHESGLLSVERSFTRIVMTDFRLQLNCLGKEINYWQHLELLHFFTLSSFATDVSMQKCVWRIVVHRLLKEHIFLRSARLHLTSAFGVPQLVERRKYHNIKGGPRKPGEGPCALGYETGRWEHLASCSGTRDKSPDALRTIDPIRFEQAHGAFVEEQAVKC